MATNVFSASFHRILVRVDSWEIDSQYPNGHFLRSLGKIGDLEAEIAAVLVENSIDVGQFTQAQVYYLFQYVQNILNSRIVLYKYRYVHQCV